MKKIVTAILALLVTLTVMGEEKKSYISEMVKVDGGSFNMGYDKPDGRANEKPLHKVTLESFYVGKYEATFEEYDKYTDAKGKPKAYDKEWGRGKRPVINVTLNDIMDFINWLNETEGLPKSYNAKGMLIDESGKITEDIRKVKGYRLPTEAEWEFAAIGGTKSKGFKYSGGNNINDIAWNGENANEQTHEVGLKQPNEIGVYDMTGNVWEWCTDIYDASFYSSGSEKNPLSSKTGAMRIYRGGSWLSEHENLLRPQFRFEGFGWQKISNLGFRLARNAE